MHNVLEITRLGLSCGLIFNLKEVSTALYYGQPYIWLSISSLICQVVYFYNKLFGLPLES